VRIAIEIEPRAPASIHTSLEILQNHQILIKSAEERIPPCLVRGLDTQEMGGKSCVAEVNLG